MDCADYKRWFSPYVDKLLKPQEHAQLADHLKNCTRCQTDLASLQQMLQVLRTMEQPASPELLSGIHKKLLREPWWERAAHRFFAPWPSSLPLHSLALATTTLLVVVVAGLPHMFQETKQSTRLIVASRPMEKQAERFRGDAITTGSFGKTQTSLEQEKQDGDKQPLRLASVARHKEAFEAQSTPLEQHPIGREAFKDKSTLSRQQDQLRADVEREADNKQPVQLASNISVSSPESTSSSTEPKAPASKTEKLGYGIGNAETSNDRRMNGVIAEQATPLQETGNYKQLATLSASVEDHLAPVNGRDEAVSANTNGSEGHVSTVDGARISEGGGAGTPHTKSGSIEQNGESVNFLPLVPGITPLPDEQSSVLLEKFRLKEKIGVSVLHQALKANQLTLRAYTARELESQGNESSIPYLIDALSDQSSHVGADYIDPGMATTRYWANESLKKLTKQDFHFVWNDPPEKRNQAILRWREWYMQKLKFGDSH